MRASPATWSRWRLHGDLTLRDPNLLLAVLVLLGLVAPGSPQEKTEEAPKEEPDYVHEKLAETHHSVRIGGETLEYTATAGNLLLREEEGKKKASFFFVAYTKEGVDDRDARPITFAFNGGPGSSSVWLHLGAFGPRRVLMDDEGRALPPPARLVDNEYSLLDLTDLVFIDPVTTGYSRAVPGEDPRQFHGYREDIESVGEFIRLYATRFERWSSPKFLAGESYGTTRAAGLAGYLQRRHGMYFNGIVLVSAILDFQTGEFAGANDLPYLLFLPTYAATAFYHQKLPEDLLQQDLRGVLDEVEAFALEDYALALLRGDRLAASERQEIIDRLARYTGLERELVEQSNLRIRDAQFFEELLRDRGLRVGRLDSRFTGPRSTRSPENGFFSDPSYEAIQGPYTSALNDYVRTELEYESALPYEILTGRVHPWSYRQFENRFVDVASTLQAAIVQNPYLKVFVANGYYDVATPYFATEYTFNHLALAEGLQENVSMGYYEAGHMMYIRTASLAKLKDDLAAFYRAALER